MLSIDKNHTKLYSMKRKIILNNTYRRGIFDVTCSSLIYRLKKNRQVNVQRVYDGFIDNVTRTICKNRF